MDLPPIRQSPRPNFPGISSKTPTGEIDLNMVKRELKRRAAWRPREIAAALVLVIGSLGTATVGIVKAFSAHDRATITEYRLDQHDDRLKELDGRLYSCCTRSNP